MIARHLSLLLLLSACGDKKPAAHVEAPHTPAAQPVAPAFPSPAIPADNPQSDDKIALGHRLFMDKRLSFDGSRSCYSCHQNGMGNADGRATALGAGDKPLGRNTPTIWNVGYHTALYWDGRADSLEKQALGAWKGGNMGVGADNLDAKAAEIGGYYAAEFATAFGLADDDVVTPNHVAMAISSYERGLICTDPIKLDEAATRGKAVFGGKGVCVACHNGPALSNGLFHDIGLGHDAEGNPMEGADIGRGKHSGVETDNGKLRTPGLRNVGKTAPYFHDGRTVTLEEAVRYMAGGGNPKAPNNDPLLADRGLTDGEVSDVVAYLNALSCGDLVEIGDQTVPGIND